LDAIEVDLADWCARPPFAWQVARLAAYRGVTRLGALTLAAEVADWRRFAHASQFMGFCGLVPSEYSSGSRVHRGRLTKAGNAHLRAQLVESAWSYQHRPSVGREIAGRQQGLDPEVVARAWAAQRRLCGRFRALAARKNTKSIVAAAIAREPAGLGRDDRLTLRLALVRRSSSAEEVTTIRATRRDPAAAGQIPESPLPRLGRSDLSQGRLPAYCRRAVPTREYQCGGQPSHIVPARRAIPKAARSPPSRGTPTLAISTIRSPTLTRDLLTCLNTMPSTRENRRLDGPFHIRVPYQGSVKGH
jgi:hypothetical protein